MKRAFLKAVRSLEMKCDHIDNEEIDALSDRSAVGEDQHVKDDLRMFVIAELLRRKEST